MAYALYKQHDTLTSMKYLRKSKADTSPKDSGGVHIEIKCAATEKFGLHCQLMKLVFFVMGFFCLLLYYAYG